VEAEEDWGPEGVEEQVNCEDGEGCFYLLFADASIPNEEGGYAHHYVEDRPDHAKGPTGRRKGRAGQLGVPG